MKNQNNQMGQKINSVIFLICIFLAPIMFFVTPKTPDIVVFCSIMFVFYVPIMPCVVPPIMHPQTWL